MPEVRIELTTYPLPRGCATTTLLRQPVAFSRANASGPLLIAEAPVERKGGGAMKSAGGNSKTDVRKARLASALRANLKRRKAGAPAAKSHAASTMPPAHAWGTAPQAGLENAPEPAHRRR